MKLNIPNPEKLKGIRKKLKGIRKIAATGAIVVLGMIPIGCGATENNPPSSQEQTDPENQTDYENQTDENTVLYYLDEKYENLNEYLDSEEVQQFNTEINETLAEMAGFIFYDDPILGYSFKDLSESGKEKALQIWGDTVIIMEEKYPEFTGRVETGFNNAKTQGIELFNSGAGALSKALEDLIGKQKSQELLESAREKQEQGRQKIREWYNQYNGQD